LVDIDSQSARLHAEVPQSSFHRVPGTGHMIHQTATGVVMSAINEVARDSSTADNSPTLPIIRSVEDRTDTKADLSGALLGASVAATVG
jgi:hypothetical protein